MQQDQQSEQQSELLKYLTQEDHHINPVKLRFTQEDEAIDKENFQQEVLSSSKRLLDDSQNSKISLSTRDNNMRMTQSCVFNIASETTSVSKILTNTNDNISNTVTPQKQEISRDALLQQWKLQKMGNSQISSSQKHTNLSKSPNPNSSQIHMQSQKISNISTAVASHTPSKRIQCKSPSFMRTPTEQSQIDKPEFQTQAQLMQQFFNSRIGYGDGKSSSVAKTPTKPVSPKFHTTMRSQISALRNVEEAPKSSGKKINPKNFFLETDRRAKQREEYTSQSSELSQHNQSQTGSQFKARPLPEYKEFVLQKSEKKSIQFKEFHLGTEERGRQKEEEREKRLEQESKEAAAARLFHATGIPDYNELSGKYLNSTGSERLLPTQPKAPNFHTDKRAEIYNMHSGVSSNSQSDSAKKASIFKAHKMPDFSKQPELIKPVHKEPTVPVDLKLNSTIRAEERKLFDEIIQQNKQKEIEQKEREEQLECDKENEEKPTTPFKANPIKKYKPVEIHRSEITLTNPESPKFKTDLRAKLNEKHSESQQI